MLLELVHGHLEALKQDFPHSVRVVDRDGGGFPWVYFLRPDAEDALVTRLVDQIALGKTRILAFDGYSRQDCDVLKRFIRDIEVYTDYERHLEAIFKERSSTMKTMYLLRGLLAHGILILTLKKKWNVQYGLHPMRDPVAVPYHAKGVPSDQAEWGHPDVCILLTCLSFYFAGLNVVQLQKCVLQVLQSDDPANEHFQTQIGASGWDIPLFQSQKSQSPERTDTQRTPLTTGFSGTNDNRYLLPLTIEQHDLNSLAYTNANVLTYLLQPRDRGYVLAARNGQRLSEKILLNKVRDLGIRVLIDAGVQILEMDNLTLVKSWMRVDMKAKAALYFNADNKPFIMYRSGTTDLKLPSNARGALTLGLTQTKDHTVQAAMRLRQLATTQSVVFFAPPEVHQSILDHRSRRRTGHQLDSRDVVQWLLEQTCRGIEQLHPLYRAQGIDFYRRSAIASKFPNHIDNKKHRAAFVREIRQVDDHSLQKIYQPRRGEATPQVLEQPSPALATFLAKLRDQTYDSDAPSSTAFQEVEQEREVAHEVEAIRKVQKPILYEALPYRGLHEDLLLFEKTGRPKPASTAHDAAAAALFHHQLFASTEVFRTVKLGKPDDTFLRPVTWLLWSTHTQTALIVTPEEAEDLLARKRRASDDRPLTHLLAYAAPVTRRMATYFNKLDYFAVPPLPAGYAAPRWLPIQLGLFAGRLYFEFDEYNAVAATLLHGGNGSAHGGLAAVEWGSAHCRDSAISSSVGHGAALTFLQEWVTTTDAEVSR
ncbi:hypothetical protein BKCO1_7800036 [Neofusicoccum parvum]|uniref:Uncharacterized protein n=1 Tax=Neofusicoccum parvum TaxID=310453 RepID=A0ACB5SC07_9PEZI|nr:hypothetical protein BKCO1_7800036 [Neofusicoccum parvum]